MYRYIIIHILFFFSTIGFSQHYQATILVDSSTFLIGDQINAEVIVNIPLGKTLEFPDLNTVFEENKLELLEEGDLVDKAGRQHQIFRKTIRFTAWEEGILFFPALEFKSPVEDSAKSFLSEKKMLTVNAPLPPSGDSLYIADIEDIILEPKNVYDYFKDIILHPISLLFLCLLLTIGAYYAYHIYRKRQETLLVVSPEEEAKKLLDALLKQQYLEQENFQAFHQQISFIIRQYIERRMHINALKIPVAEFITQLPQKWVSGTLLTMLTEVLENADLIIYAKASPLQAGNDLAVKSIQQLLQHIEEQLQQEQS